MKRKFDMFQCVVLVRDVDESSELGLSKGEKFCAGTDGVVVEHLKDNWIMVELFDNEGWTLDVLASPEAYFRAATKEEIKEIRNRPPLDIDKAVTSNS
jgi:hypothetical protein